MYISIKHENMSPFIGEVQEENFIRKQKTGTIP